jgi:hypothetical protein
MNSAGRKFALNRDSPDESQTGIMFAFSRPSCKNAYQLTTRAGEHDV